MKPELDAILDELEDRVYVIKQYTPNFALHQMGLKTISDRMTLKEASARALELMTNHPDEILKFSFVIVKDTSCPTIH
jgi:hypothetical protein